MLDEGADPGRKPQKLCPGDGALSVRARMVDTLIERMPSFKAAEHEDPVPRASACMLKLHASRSVAILGPGPCVPTTLHALLLPHPSSVRRCSQTFLQAKQVLPTNQSAELMQNAKAEGSGQISLLATLFNSLIAAGRVLSDISYL